MANVYDERTRQELLMHRQFCDPRSAEIIGQLVRWLDEADAAKMQRAFHDQRLALESAEASLSEAKAALAQAEAQRDAALQLARVHTDAEIEAGLERARAEKLEGALRELVPLLEDVHDKFDRKRTDKALAIVADALGTTEGRRP